MVFGLETVTKTLKVLMRVAAAAAVLGFMISGPVQIPVSAEQTGRENTAAAEGSEEALPFDEAIESFYRNSEGITDEQILASARSILSDGNVLYSELNEGESRNVLNALSAYEEAKAEYLMSAINNGKLTGNTVNELLTASSGAADTNFAAVSSAKDQEDAVRSEWEKQGDYALMMIAENAVIREMIPRYRIVSCTKKDRKIELAVDEWMTLGYSASGQSETVNASAYSYTFDLTLECSDHDTWMPSEINGTEANFAWLGEGEDPVKESDEAPAALYEVRSDMIDAPAAYAQLGSSDGKTLSYIIDGSAAVPSAGVRQAGDANDLTADTLYAQGAEVYDAASAGYTYSPAKAVAYADKYWKKYNRSYKEYRGVDCANFVSQCLFAGGMPKTSDWYPQSVNWINVMGHIRHFKSYGMFLTASNANVRVGNPVYYDWNGNSTYDHVGICVGVNSSGMPVVDAHTNNVYHVPWRMGSRGKRGTIVLRKSSASSRNDSSSEAKTAAKNVWQTIGDNVYYIGSDGRYVKNRFLTIGGARYYFHSNGERVTGFFKVGTKWYYASVKNGKLLKGFQYIGGKIYYFYPTDYSRITGGMHKIGNATYYFNSKGVRQISFIQVGNKWYYADKKTGKFVKGWKKISGEWYYFDKKTMVKTIGWKTINGKKCYFDSKGILRKGKHG